MIVPDNDCVFEPVELLDGVSDFVPERDDVCVRDGVNVEGDVTETVGVEVKDEPAEGVKLFEGTGCTLPII